MTNEKCRFQYALEQYATDNALKNLTIYLGMKSKSYTWYWDDNQTALTFGKNILLSLQNIREFIYNIEWVF